jgi:hypothetical protein
MRKLLTILVLASSPSLASRAQSSPAALSLDHAIQDLASMSPSNPSAYNRTATAVSYHGDQDSTHGSRLLFYDWPKGFIIGAYDTVLNNPNLYLNYDKLNHHLYFTFDGKPILEVESSQAREIHFLSGDKPTVLVRVDGIDPQAFFQRLSDSAGTHHYILYRLTRTRYHRANYQTDGLVATGNNYDEYLDDYEYYIVMPGGRQYALVTPKRKSVEAALGPKAGSWLTTHHESRIDEATLVRLVNGLNAANAQPQAPAQ